MPEGKHTIHAVTFGRPGSDDIRFAARAAALKNARHHVHMLNEHNWFLPRLKGIWWIDGQLNLLHMHGIDIAQNMRQFYALRLHGFAGDLILGGSYLEPEFINQQPANVADRIFRFMRRSNSLYNKQALMAHLRDKLDTYPTTDSFFLQNRVRRFTSNGPRLSESFAFDRKPTYDNALMEFCYALPDKFRYQSNVYKHMLLMYFPEYFRTIPWQKTGIPITAGKQRTWLAYQSRRVWRKAHSVGATLGIRLPDHISYTNYEHWARTEPARSFIRAMLLNPAAHWRAYVPVESTDRLIQDHLSYIGKTTAEDILLLLTFEIYLNQLDRARFQTS
jgi:asparagine synthase (glutamine-hydrolysing)